MSRCEACRKMRTKRINESLERHSDSVIDWPLPKMGGLFVVSYRLKLRSGIVPN